MRHRLKRSTTPIERRKSVEASACGTLDQKARKPGGRRQRRCVSAVCGRARPCLRPRLAVIEHGQATVVAQEFGVNRCGAIDDACEAAPRKGREWKAGMPPPRMLSRPGISGRTTT